MASARGAVAEKAPITEFRNLRADPNASGSRWRSGARRPNSAGRVSSYRKRLAASTLVLSARD